MTKRKAENSVGVFGHRKVNYQKATCFFENVRYSELEVIGDYIRKNLHPHQKDVLELGSGTGFLTSYLSRIGFVIDATDFEFDRPFEARHFERCDLRASFPTIALENSYDIVISLATLHHVAERSSGILPSSLCTGICRALKENGSLIVLDVAPGDSAKVEKNTSAQRVGTFFSEVIDRFTVPAHDGRYLNGDIVQQQFQSVGLSKTEHSFRDCAWYFDTEDQMAAFVKSLFNLEGLSIQKVKDYLKNIVGYELNDRLKLNWGLQMITASNPISTK